MFDPSNVDAGATEIDGNAGTVRGAPVLGAARINGGTREGYAISSEGRLLVFNHDSNALLWKGVVVQNGEAVQGHMTFDTNRARCESKTGLLYVGTDSGRVYSIIVDTPALVDSPDAWPKYQRTMGNAGNADTSFPINWPAACP